MLNRVWQQWRCMRHVPARQLLRRLMLIAKRQTLSRLPSSLLPRHCVPLPCVEHPPQNPYAARVQLAEEFADGYALTHLNRRFSLNSPVDWLLKCDPQATHLERLALHYHEFLEAVPFEDGRRLILEWIDHNLPFRRGYWLDSWNSYAISIRTVCWMQWIAAYRELLEDTERARILSSLCEQVRFLRRNLETDICGNHLIKNVRCLIWSSAFFAGKEADQWGALGRRLLRQQLDQQFLPDGMHFELSPAYHGQVFGDLLDCAVCLEGEERRQLLDSLAPAAQCLSQLTHPDGLVSLFSDGALHMVYSPEEYLAVWLRLGGSHVTREAVTQLQASGYYGWSGRRSDVLIDCGRICADALPAHGHGDALSFEWDVDGQRIVVDQGVYQYEAGENRLLDRSARSHNTVTVGDHDQAKFIGSFRTGARSRVRCDRWTASPAGMSLTGSCAWQPQGNVAIQHHREFEADDGRLRLVDQVAAPKQTGRVTSRILLHHECRVTVESPRSALIVRGATRILLTTDVGMTLQEAFWSPDFGQRISTVRIVLDLGVAPAHATVEFCILPLK
ncbi:MAG: alginate lyase family protein [Planctomycetaceae bacterium]|nr:alginate lyase family protein [Planctomycetaceae bacterium]